MIAVAFDSKPLESTSVVAEITSESASQARALPATSFLVDGASWNGNGSIISYSSGEEKGYGLNIDEALVSSDLERPVVYFQWEIDSRDGQQLQLSGPDFPVDIRYGLWNNRQNDVVHSQVRLPFTIDPRESGMSVADGEYYVIQMMFTEGAGRDTVVEAKAIQP